MENNNEQPVYKAILSGDEMKALEVEVIEWWKQALDNLEMDEMYRAIKY